jgi:hypothetical protein
MPLLPKDGLMFKLSRRAVGGGLVALLAFAGAACSDDEEPTETGDAPEETTTTGAEAEETTTTAGDDEAADVVEIIGTNDLESYVFEDVPTEAVPVGSQLSLTNTGTEPHEIVALRIPDDETRTIDEIAALPEDEQEALFADPAALATVIVALTGTTDTPGAVEGDGTLTEPGRYALICTFPTGITDDVVANATGPLDPGDAPPHVALGMYAELIVE